jgi:putative endopeptidase
MRFLKILFFLSLFASLLHVSAVPLGSAAPQGIDRADMDTSVPACRDFNRFANGGWMAKNPVPADYPNWGTFSELSERNREALHAILEEAAKNAGAPKGSDEQKVGDFYASCMDEGQIESAGVGPLEPEFERVKAIHDRGTLEDEIARLQGYGVDAIFRFGSQQDRKDSTQVIAGASQSGLGMPDRDYYTKTDDKSKELREQYIQHIAKMFELLGDEPAKAAEEAQTIMSLETKLAESSMTRVERRDPEKTYHKMNAAQLQVLTPNFSWEGYFDRLGYAQIREVNIGQPKFFEAASGLLSSVPIEDWKTYLRWHLVNAAAPALSRKFVEEDFNFKGRTLTGTKEILPRWKRCVAATDRQLGFALGKVYVQRYFPPEAKARADRMVHYLIEALRNDLQTLPWMGPQTRQAALAKLDAFTPKIGYPDRWRDYSAYQVDRGPYVENVLRGDLFEFHRDLNKIAKPVDRTEWGMTPPTVNAYYSAPMNEIVFPAGILQPPFFDPKADDAVNYGGIGAVIGHEMTHGFDDEGSKFDGQGNLKNWWTADDLKNFQARAACVEKQFDGYVVMEDLHENGKLVLGESIADLGGLTIALKAYEKSLEGKPRPEAIDGLTPEQRFFLAWGHIWAQNARPEFERLQLNVNPHPLGRFRALGAPSNMAAFAQAFSCQPGDPMVRSEPCVIW